MSNADTFIQMYKDVWVGSEIRPRGLLCREVIDYKMTLEMDGNPVTSFTDRGLNLKYAKEEFKWYLRADRFDDTIEKYASMWAKVRQPDGSYFSNYGQYIFPKQFKFVVNELLRDPDSRRASIVLLKAEHLFHENKDIVCTYAINFRIRNHALHMTVMMRSNDVIFGTTNDVFCFSMLYRMVYALLLIHMPLRKGQYTHFVNSLHVYDRHFDMIQAIIKQGLDGYQKIFIPWPDEREVRLTLKNGLNPKRGAWSEWLCK